MHTMKKLAIVAVAAMIAGACGQNGQDRENAPEAAVKNVTGDVLAAVLRDMLNEVPPGDTVYVSFGESWQDRVDPPEGFLTRFDGVEADLAPVGRYGPQPGYTPYLLVVHMDRREGDAEAWVRATRYQFGAGTAMGYTAHAVKENGGWRVDGREDLWRR